MELKHTSISCPHCGHGLHLDLDYSNGAQDFFEECPSCCNDIHLKLALDEVNRRLNLSVSADDEQIY